MTEPTVATFPRELSSSTFRMSRITDCLTTAEGGKHNQSQREVV